MDNLKYRISYEYLGPSKENPFATKPLSPDQVQHYLDGLCAILPHQFSCTFEGNSLLVTVVTGDSEQDTDTALERCVINLNRTTSGLLLKIDKLSEQ